MTTTPNDRIRRIFEAVDQKSLDAASRPGKARDALIAQVRETYQAAGDEVDEETIGAAVDEILSQEVRDREQATREETEQAARAAWARSIPGWAWVLMGMGALVLVVPVARVLFRVIELLLRVVI